MRYAYSSAQCYMYDNNVASVVILATQNVYTNATVYLQAIHVLFTCKVHTCVNILVHFVLFSGGSGNSKRGVPCRSYCARSVRKFGPHSLLHVSRPFFVQRKLASSAVTVTVDLSV